MLNRSGKTPLQTQAASRSTQLHISNVQAAILGVVTVVLKPGRHPATQALIEGSDLGQ